MGNRTNAEIIQLLRGKLTRIWPGPIPLDIHWAMSPFDCTLRIVYDGGTYRVEHYIRKAQQLGDEARNNADTARMRVDR